MKNEYKSFADAFEAGKKIGFMAGFRKATQGVIDNCKKMQDKAANIDKDK